MEIDVSNWAVIRDEPGGRDRNKRWIAEHADAPRTDQWLWKLRTATGSGSQFALTDCAEVFTSRLAGLLGLPAARCEFAVSRGELGLISHNVAPAGFDLHPGRAYLAEVDGYEHRSPTGQGGGLMRLDKGYTLDAVETVLEGVDPPPLGLESESSSSFAVFSGYLVLDALVGNTDRHAGNWALLEREQDGRRFLAPTFDHGSALGAGLTSENRRAKNPQSWARRGCSAPFGRESLVSLARDAVSRSGADIWIRRVADLGHGQIRKTLEAPQSRLSEQAATFMEKVLLENQRRLSHDFVGQN